MYIDTMNDIPMLKLFLLLAHVKFIQC